ncbi:monooxygenase [Actinoplanes sp. TBRC 11911]|uniref:monooxygenase n=1 Tax=Actinoplanes sp. TBRC 11911 TaxID=2729386 RepID=UPI002007177D|nr:monooxygenase [Actinoplanes sp. TBRC 11911]
MALSRRPPHASFAKFVGTARGFRPSDADLTRYAAITVSDSPVLFPGWDRLATAHCRVDLALLSSRGRWSGTEPFGTPTTDPGGMVLALTRARLRPAKALTFWRAIPPVATELDKAPGLLAHFGMGEAPIGWQGTVSVWRGSSDLTRFAYRQPEHRAVIARTPADRWYAEDLFARFAVREISGDRSVLGWVAEEEAGRNR